MEMKKDFRWRIEGLSCQDADQIADGFLSKGFDVKQIKGCLVDSYLIYLDGKRGLKWEDWDGEHNVNFDYLLFLEEYLNSWSSGITAYGIKERGMTEKEKEIIESFEYKFEQQFEEVL